MCSPEGCYEDSTKATPRTDHSVRSPGQLLQWQRVQKGLVAEKEAWVAKNPKGFKLLMLGDSITEYLTGKSFGVEVAAKADIKAAFKAVFPDDVLPMGIAGDQTQHLLWRMGEDGGELNGLLPEFVNVLIGTNNLGAGMSPEAAFEGVKEVVKEIKASLPSSTIILEQLFPRGDAGGDLQETVAQVNALIREQWKGDKTLHLSHCGQIFVMEGSNNLDERSWILNIDLMPDKLHPGAHGVKLWMECLEEMLNRR